MGARLDLSSSRTRFSMTHFLYRGSMSTFPYFLCESGWLFSSWASLVKTRRNCSVPEDVLPSVFTNQSLWNHLVTVFALTSSSREFFFLFFLGTEEEKGLFSSLTPQSQDQCVSCSNLWSYKSKGLVRPSHTEGQDLTPTQRKCCVSSQLEPSQRLKRTKTLTNKLPFWLRDLFTAPKTVSVTWEILSKYCRNLHPVNWVSSLCQALWQGMAIQKQESTGDTHFREE